MCLTGLKLLDLSFNDIGVLKKKLINNLVNIEELYLVSCNIETIEEKAFNGLANLKVLDLSKNIQHFEKYNEF